ncbi:DNA gyrase/topoisomerase IV subunit A [Candidatus Poriferisodalis sp.]|uniref:DNA gyrase/topoisomerase IV subunit A n=1 Tax=Candidatus Poriferisodalis sp. TaxID=3101277 RepID=UPI003B02D6AE
MAAPTAPAEIAREIRDTDVADEMRNSFMPYALSVMTARAIPDVRDGLKPVQRRILFVMDDLGLRPGTPFRKSAGVVGEVMGKYHPHGDNAIYEAMVRMGQSFSMSVPLVAPKGNFGSLDDPPAAYRYTEARLTEASMTMVAGIDEDTVDLVASFDGERSEPSCLPALLPNLLVNGASGIAVGMATNMAPHNLTEVAAAIKLVLRRPQRKPGTDALMKVLPGPDFPTGGIVVCDEQLTEAYERGRGSVRIRAEVHLEPMTATRQAIVVTELPYTVGPERVLAKIRALMKTGQLDQVGEAADLSDRAGGLRLVIECRPHADPHQVLAELWRKTPLEESFGINNVVLVGGVPQTLGVRELCEQYIAHRLDVIVRRTQHRLARAREREHIVEGLLIALDDIDTAIAVIRSSADVGTARAALTARLRLTEVQANHILDMQLRRLTGLETQKLRDELLDLRAAIAAYLATLESDEQRRQIIADELDELVQRFGTPRRSRLVDRALLDARAERPAGAAALSDGGGGAQCASPAGTAAAGVGPGSVVGVSTVTLSTSGLLGRRHAEDPLSAKPGRHDVLVASIVVSDLEQVTVLTDHARLFAIAVRDIPEMARGSRGASAGELLDLSRGERIVALWSADADTDHLALVARGGSAKRVETAALLSRRDGTSAMRLADRDRLVAAFAASATAELAVMSSAGRVLRTACEEIPLRRPDAGGVNLISLAHGATALAAAPIAFGSLAVAVTDEGTLKVTAMSEVPARRRGGAGSPVVRFGGFETCVAYAWIGLDRQIAAVVAADGDGKRLDPTPARPELVPTKRNLRARLAGPKIVALGQDRFA